PCCGREARRCGADGRRRTGSARPRTPAGRPSPPRWRQCRQPSGDTGAVRSFCASSFVDPPAALIGAWDEPGHPHWFCTRGHGTCGPSTLSVAVVRRPAVREALAAGRVVLGAHHATAVAVAGEL